MRLFHVHFRPQHSTVHDSAHQKLEYLYRKKIKLFILFNRMSIRTNSVHLHRDGQFFGGIANEFHRKELVESDRDANCSSENYTTLYQRASPEN